MDADAYENYDFAEFVVRFAGDDYGRMYNRVLEREMSAYRFVNGQLTPVTNKTEIQAIEAAPGEAERSGFKGAARHLEASLTLLSDRTAPDYRNAIKEAISAVESIAQVLTGEKTLGQALKVIEKKMPLHGSLREAFSKLYGYTSDAGGIRHAMLEDPNVDFEDAKYMLVVCSAFVSFLIARVAKHGLGPAQAS